MDPSISKFFCGESIKDTWFSEEELKGVCGHISSVGFLLQADGLSVWEKKLCL